MPRNKLPDAQNSVLGLSVGAGAERVGPGEVRHPLPVWGSPHVGFPAVLPVSERCAPAPRVRDGAPPPLVVAAVSRKACR